MLFLKLSPCQILNNLSLYRDYRPVKTNKNHFDYSYDVNVSYKYPDEKRLNFYEKILFIKQKVHIQFSLNKYTYLQLFLNQSRFELTYI